MNLKRQLLMLLVFALAISLAGVGTAQGQAQIKNPDTLTVQTIGDPESLDPSWIYDTASAEVNWPNVYESLIFFKGGRTDLYEPMLASAVPSVANGGVSKDGRTYTFTLRAGVKFHDGNPLTGEDVKYSIMRFTLTDRDGGPSWILLAPILGFENQATRDDKGKLLPTVWDAMNRAITVKGNTVAITLKRPYGPFLNIMAQWAQVVSKKFVVKNGGWDGGKATLAKYNNPENAEKQELFDKDAGTGPFKLERWDHANSVITLVRNASYWRAPAKLRRIVIQKVEEFGPRRLALQNGDADMIDTGGRVNQPALTGVPGVRIVDDLSTLLNSPALFLNFNINTEANPDIGSAKLDGNGIPANFFSDIHVRRALAYLFDRDRFIAEAQRGKGRAANGPIPYGLLGYNPKGKWYEVSRDKAIAEFREAWGGQAWERGFKFSVLFNTGNLNRQTGSQMMKEAIESLNPKFKVDTRGVTWSSYLGLMNAKKLPVFFIGWLADYADPDNFTVPFMHSTGTFAQNQSYKNPEVDKIIEQAAQETDNVKRQALYVRLQEIAYTDVPTIYIVYPVDWVVMRTWVKGWYFNPIFPSSRGFYYSIYKG